MSVYKRIAVNLLKKFPAQHYFSTGGRHSYNLLIRVEYEQETDGRWLAEVMELPGVMQYGDTYSDAIKNTLILALKSLDKKVGK